MADYLDQVRNSVQSRADTTANVVEQYAALPLHEDNQEVSIIFKRCLDRFFSVDNEYFRNYDKRSV